MNATYNNCPDLIHIIGYALTRFCHGLDGNVLLVGHEAQHGEDGETRHEAGAAVQTAQHETVPKEQDGEQERDQHLPYELPIGFTQQATETDVMSETWTLNQNKMWQGTHLYQSLSKRALY